jgi:Flp pilus assembly protein TadB
VRKRNRMVSQLPRLADEARRAARAGRPVGHRAVVAAGRSIRLRLSSLVRGSVRDRDLGGPLVSVQQYPAPVCHFFFIITN